MSRQRVAPVRWTARAGAWLGIGASPAALVLGAGLAARHDGPVPLLALLAGAALMVLVLVGSGYLGLVPPHGEGDTLSGLAPRYLAASGARVLNALLAAAMVGWFGFNVGLGGAALAALLGVPGPVGPLLLGVPTVALSLGGMRRWNAVALVATGSALVLTLVVTARLAAPAAPVTGALGAPALALADVAGFLGYVAVFALRAPDFSVGLAGPRDLARCVALLVLPMALVAVAGIALQRGTGSADLVATLAATGGLAAGNLLVAIAVVAPTFTTAYSGALALRAITGLSERAAVLVIAVPGLLLAAARFDRLLLPWLTLLAAALPPLVVPLAVEAARRRRGGAPREVPPWTWVPVRTVPGAVAGRRASAGRG